MQFSRASATAPRAPFQSQRRLIELDKEVKEFCQQFTSSEYYFAEVGEST